MQEGQNLHLDYWTSSLHILAASIIFKNGFAHWQIEEPDEHCSGSSGKCWESRRLGGPGFSFKNNLESKVR